MILTFHKVFPDQKTEWWISADQFYQNMQSIKSREVVYLDDYDYNNPNHIVVTFDGIYENIFHFALPILQNFNFPFELFVIGDYIGRDNTFDQQVEPPCRFANVHQLEELVRHGGRLQWHTKSHSRLDKLDSNELDAELTVPRELSDRFHVPNFRWFAYPHGVRNNNATKIISKKFAGALACEDGRNDDRYYLPRKTVFPGASFYKGTVAAIVANYNYGHLLREAILSLERQTSKPDEILIIDDASTDDSDKVLKSLEDTGYCVIRNDHNLGIVANFRRAVGLTNSDYIFILGADNRLRSDFVAQCRSALDADNEAAVAYTDIIIFGHLAGQLAQKVGAKLLGHSADQNWDVYGWDFPDPTPDRLASFETDNFAHGSSMYRREFYDRVGGYRTADGPEDHDLFFRIWQVGGKLVHVRARLLEYRQHSRTQANTVLGLALENRELRNERERLQTRVKTLSGEVGALNETLARIMNSYSWRVTAPLREVHGFLRRHVRRRK